MQGEEREKSERLVNFHPISKKKRKEGKRDGSQKKKKNCSI